MHGERLARAPGGRGRQDERGAVGFVGLVQRQLQARALPVAGKSADELVDAIGEGHRGRRLFTFVEPSWDC